VNRRLRMTGALLVSLALAGTACGGGDETGGVATLGGSEESPSPSPSPADPEEAFLDFAECLREHGIEVGDPGEGGGVFEVGREDQEDFREAEEACRHLIEDVVQEGIDRIPPEERERILEQQLRFAECMREHGIDFPDPQVEDGGLIGFGPGEGMDPTDPEFQEAQEACQDLLPDFRRIREEAP